MIEACSSCGYTVDPNCEVCKGEGEYDARAAVPLANAVRVASDDAVQEQKALLDRADQARQAEADRVSKEVSSAVSTHEDADFQVRALGVVANLPANGATNIQASRAIDLIGCALVALKANVPLYRSPQVLLGLRKKAEGFNLWVLPGGTHETNESPEECVRRETEEEIGVLRLIGLKPVSFAYNSDNPLRKYLMLYYTAYIAGEEPRIVAKHEFSDLQWFDVDTLPAEMWQTDRDAIASTLMMRPK